MLGIFYFLSPNTFFFGDAAAVTQKHIMFSQQQCFLSCVLLSEIFRGDGLAVGFLLSKAKNHGKNKNSKTPNKKLRGGTRSSNTNTSGHPENDKNRYNNNKDDDMQVLENISQWRVSVEGGSGDEEVISEQFLGKVLEEGDSDESATMDATTATTTTTSTTTAKTTKPTVVKKGHTTTKGKKDKKINPKTIKVVVSPSSSPTPSPNTSPQAKPNPSNNNNKGNKTKAAAATAATKTGDDTIVAEWQRKRPVPRPKKLDDQDLYQRVEEVHFETGTLFLYRGGQHRRVEYVPRV
jgi:hypothetical protein